MRNKKVIGKMTDERKGVPIVKFAELKSIMYSFVKDIEKELIKMLSEKMNHQDVLLSKKSDAQN